MLFQVVSNFFYIVLTFKTVMAMYIVQLTIINCDALIFFGINDLSPLNILSMLFLQRKPEYIHLNDTSTLTYNCQKSKLMHGLCMHISESQIHGLFKKIQGHVSANSSTKH
jgi:hypothetical protein